MKAKTGSWASILSGSLSREKLGGNRKKKRILHFFNFPFSIKLFRVQVIRSLIFHFCLKNRIKYFSINPIKYPKQNIQQCGHFLEADGPIIKLSKSSKVYLLSFRFHNNKKIYMKFNLSIELLSSQEYFVVYLASLHEIYLVGGFQNMRDVQDIGSDSIYLYFLQFHVFKCNLCQKLLLSNVWCAQIC